MLWLIEHGHSPRDVAETWTEEQFSVALDALADSSAKTSGRGSNVSGDDFLNFFGN